MNAVELLAILQQGATLKMRYKHRTLKRRYIVTLTNGETFQVQRSMVEALLKARSITGFYWSGGEVDYYLLDQQVVRPYTGSINDPTR